MRIIPEQMSQPQQVIKNPPLQAQEGTIIPNKVGNSQQNTSNITPSLNPITNTEDKEIIIRKKAQYRAFMKLIKARKYTSAILSSRVLGVDRSTIQSWLQTRKVQELLANTYDSYINDIEKAKDWKAKAYLLDKLEDKDNTKDTPIQLNNLIQINI